MKKFINIIFLMNFCPMIYAYDFYDSSTNSLNIPSVQVGSTIYSDVVITVGNVVKVGGTSTLNQTYELNSLNMKRVNISSPVTLNYNVSGVVNSSAFTGSGSVISNPLTATTFEGNAAKSQSTLSSTLIMGSNGSTPTTYNEIYFYDSNNNVIGFLDTLYHVVSSYKQLPNKVSNYSSGIWITTNDYLDSSKKVALGKTIFSYDVYPSNDVNPYVNITKSTRNAADNVDSMMISTFILTNQGLIPTTRTSITNGQISGYTQIMIIQ